jgi:hypothetical protein
LTSRSTTFFDRPVATFNCVLLRGFCLRASMIFVGTSARWFRGFGAVAGDGAAAVVLGGADRPVLVK